MLAAHSERRDQHLEPALDFEPSLGEAETAPLKQQTKKKLFTPFNIIIVIAAVVAVGIGAYYLLNMTQSKDIQNQIQQSHDKIISYADSSKKEGSNSGSSSSKASANNNKPNARSQPASKTVISSNSKLTGSSSSGSPGDDEDENNRDDGSEKRKNTGSVGSTTGDQNSEEDSQEEESSGEAYDTEPVVWVDQNAPNTKTPMVGSTRDGGR